MAKTIDRATWASLRKLHTRFMVWCAAAHEEPTAANLLRWLYLPDFAPDRDRWYMGREAEVQPSQPEPLSDAFGG